MAMIIKRRKERGTGDGEEHVVGGGAAVDLL